jgi:hypothetical protein
VTDPFIQAHAFIQRFVLDRRGGIAVIAGLSLPVFAVLAVGAVDLVSVNSDRSAIQDAVDQAALQAAGQLSVSDANSVGQRAQAYLDMQLQPLKDRCDYKVVTDVAPDGKSVKVSVEGRRMSYFGSMLPPGGWPLHISATATPMGQVPLCVLSTGADAKNKITMRDAAKITANGCLVHSDGDITVASTALLQAATVQASGLASGRILPQAEAGAATIDDPFSSMAIKADSLCTPVDKLYNSGALSLPPGVHCGNITLDNDATLTLQPGDHFFMKGELELKKTAKLGGSDVVLIFDKDSEFKFGDSSQINLQGRKSGAYAGFVIATTRTNTETFEISSAAARELLGTIYIPSAKLAVSGAGGAVGDQSAWTVIVANSIDVSGSPNLVINSNYAGSSVPVPSGVGPTMKGARLSK